MSTGFPTVRRAEIAGAEPATEQLSLDKGQAPEPSEATLEEPEPWPEPTVEELASLRAIQRKAIADHPPEADPALEQRVRSASGGRPLEDRLLRPMEEAFGRDFSAVRVHDGPGDQADALQLRARAFTFGSHIWFAPGESPADRRLLAHELVHVVQQGQAPAHAKIPIASDPAPGLRDDSHQLRRAMDEESTEENRAQEIGYLSGKVRAYVAECAGDIPGYPLLTTVLARDPITDRPVDGSASNVLREFVKLVPGGENIYQNLTESGALQRGYAWVLERLVALGLTWSSIKGLFRKAWDAVRAFGWLPLSGAWEIVKQAFEPMLRSLRLFASEAASRLSQFIFEGALRLGGPMAERALGVFRQAGHTLTIIMNDPVGFAANLISAVALGFKQFRDNIVTHLKTGFVTWLTGNLARAGLQLPEKWDLRGVVSVVLQVLGITYSKVRQKLVKAIGEPRVAALETAFDFLRVLVTEGIIGAWRKLIEFAGNLQEKVFSAIQDWTITKVVQQAVARIVLMFNPAGAVIQAVLAIYKTIVFFIEKAQQIAAVVESVLSSIGAIARGQLASAANFVEQTMGKTIPVVLGFLAGFVGLGDISEQIRKIIKSIQESVDAALTRLVNFIVEKAKAILGAVKAGAAAIVQWWKRKLTFKAGGEVHHLYFDGANPGADVIIESVPKKVRAFLESNKPPNDKPNAKKLHEEAWAQYRKLEQSRRRATANADKANTTLDAEVAKEFELLKDGLCALLDATAGTLGRPVTRVVFAPAVGGLGQKMEAHPLTDMAPKGTKPDAASEVWDLVNKRRYESGYAYYQRGHLLSQELGGEGTEENLTPLTRSANTLNETRAEKHVKKRIEEWRNNSTAGTEPEPEVAISYSVTPIYEPGRTIPSHLETALTKPGSYTPTQQDEIRKILQAECKLARSLVVKADLLKVDGSGNLVHKADLVSIPPIPNEIPDTIPILKKP